MKLKNALLALCVTTMSAMAFAGAPTTSAPTPTVNPDQVKSAFCDAYTQFTKWDYLTYGNALGQTITINGNDNVAWFSPGGWGGVGVGSRNVADMEYLHVDVYSGGITNFRIGFSTWSGGEKYAENYVKDTPEGEWTSIDIPLTAFGEYNFADMQVMRFTVSGSGDYTIDNVYFYTTKKPDDTLPKKTSPKPVVDASLVGSCYSDAYEPKFNFNGYNNNGCILTSKEIAPGEHVLEVKDFRWAHFALGEVAGESTVDLSGYDRVHFDVYVPAGNVTASIQPGMYNVSSKQEAFSGAQTLKPGDWISVDLKMQDFKNVGLTAVNNMTFKDPANKTGLVYLDNVFFYKGDEVKPGDGEIIGSDTFSILPAPLPENAASTVKSIYSDAYTPVGSITFDGGNGSIQFEEIDVKGDKMYKMSSFNYAKFPIGTVDVSDMEYLHFDVAVPNKDAGKPIPKIMPVLVNGSTSKYTGDYALTPGKWTSINVKVADFTAKGLDPSKLTEIRFKHNGSASDDGDVIIDNIYFSKEAGATSSIDNEWGTTSTGGDDPIISEIPVAPTPTHPASDVKAFFSDAYSLTGKFEIPTNSEYDKNGLIEIIKHENGEQVAKITNLNWRVVNLGQRDVSDKGYLHVDYYAPAENGVQSVCINLTNWDTKNGSAYELDGDQQNYRTVKAGEWVSYDIPLKNFHSTDPSKEFDFSKDMACVRFYAGDGSRGKTLYVDNFYFWGAPEQGGGDDDKDQYPPIQDSSAGELPPMNVPMLGVNLSSASGGSVPGRFGTDYMYPRLEDLYYFKAKGVRLIRLPFRAARVAEDITNPTQLDTQDLNALKAVVAEAERLGMWVFLDAHDYAERTTNGTQDLLGNGEYTYERFGKMWGAIAAEFAGYKNIWGYDLQNEPKVSATVLLNAYQAAIDEIRKVDSNAQIIVEATNWASAYEWIYGDRQDKQYPEYSTEVAWSYKQNSPWLLANLSDPQHKIVYEAHGYFDQDNSGTYTKGFANVDYRKRFLPFLEWCATNNAKGLIGEFGVPYNEHSSGDPRYMDILDGALQLFREYGMNATYWCAGAMYEGNSLSCQPDKSPLYGNYAKEKSTMAVLEQYFTNWAESSSVTEIGESAINNGNGKMYNVMGIEVDETYKGIVIVNGKKYINK